MVDLYSDFNVNSETVEETSAYFQIKSPEDFIQKVTIKEISLFESSYGKAMKVVIQSGGRETNGLVTNEITGDVTYNQGGTEKVIKAESLMATQKAVITQLGRALMGDSFAFKAVKPGFEGMLDGLITATKSAWSSKELYARLTLNKTFANLATKGGRIFADEASKLTVPTADIIALNSLLNVTPDKPQDDGEAQTPMF